MRDFFERECERNHTKVSEFFSQKQSLRKSLPPLSSMGVKEKGVGFSQCLFLSVITSI